MAKEGSKMTIFQYLHQCTKEQMAIRFLKLSVEEDGTQVWETPDGVIFDHWEYEAALEHTIKWLEEEV